MGVEGSPFKEKVLIQTIYWNLIMQTDSILLLGKKRKGQSSTKPQWSEVKELKRRSASWIRLVTPWPVGTH